MYPLHYGSECFLIGGIYSTYCVYSSCRMPWLNHFVIVIKTSKQSFPRPYWTWIFTLPHLYYIHITYARVRHFHSSTLLKSGAVFLRLHFLLSTTWSVSRREYHDTSSETDLFSSLSFFFYVSLEALSVFFFSPFEQPPFAEKSQFSHLSNWHNHLYT